VGTLFDHLSALFAAPQPVPVEDLRTSLTRSLPRRAILEVVERSPGIPLGVLITRLPYGSGTVYHHLQVLERAGLVTTMASGRRRLIYPTAPSATAPPDTRHLVLLSTPTARRIARVIVDRPGCSIGEIFLRTGASPRMVYYNLKQLTAAGLVSSASATRYKQLTASPALPIILARAERMVAEADRGART